MGLYKPSELRQFLESLGVSPKKGLSQNFLIDGNILKKMVEAAQLKKGETVLEIGPGPGALTEALLGEGVRVIAIEKDEVLARHLERLDSRDSLRVIQEDIRHVDLAKLLEREGKVKVVANIPYSITGLLLQTLLPLGKHIQSLHLMVQKEVADRCCACLNEKDYSSFTLFVQYHATPKRLFTVSKNSFYPPPNIDSAILQLIPHPPPVEAPEKPLFEIIQQAFKQRRKMLRASLIPKKTQKLEFCQSQRSRFDPIETAPIQMDRSDAEGVKDGDADTGKNQVLSFLGYKIFASPKEIEQGLLSLGHKETARPQELTLEDFSALFFLLDAVEGIEGEDHTKDKHDN